MLFSVMLLCFLKCCVYCNIVGFSVMSFFCNVDVSFFDVSFCEMCFCFVKCCFVCWNVLTFRATVENWFKICVNCHFKREKAETGTWLHCLLPAPALTFHDLNSTYCLFITCPQQVSDSGTWMWEHKGIHKSWIQAFQFRSHIDAG